MPNSREHEKKSKTISLRSLGRSESLTKLAGRVVGRRTRAESVSETDSPDRSAISGNEEESSPQNFGTIRRAPVERTKTQDEPDEIKRGDGTPFSQIHVAEHSRIHTGDVYNNIYASDAARANYLDTRFGYSQGFDYSLSPYRAGTTQHSASYTAIKNRARFTSKKRPAVSARHS
jgi:hypothetical protein